MGIRPLISERTPIENVEVEYERTVGPKKDMKPGFNRVRLLNLNQTEIELATRESFRPGEKLALSMHVKGVKDYLQAEAEVKKCARITVFKQHAFAVLLQFAKLAPDQTGKLSWAQEQLIPKQRAAPLRREEDRSSPPASAASRAPEAAAATAVTEEPAAAEAPAPAATKPPSVNRPVALIQLIDALQKFDVSKDLVTAVIEAAGSGLDVEVLYPVKAQAQPQAEDEGPAEASEPTLPAEGVARPMNVYRLASNTRIWFSEAGLPLGPASELLYLSRIKSPEKCFGMALEVDSMTQSGAPSFKRGSILIFSSAEKVESGDFAFIKTRACDDFAQVFFDKNEEVRIRSLNPAYPERVVRRMEVRILCKLVGHYEEAGS